MIEWKASAEPVPYEDALIFMDERAAAIREGAAPECIWLLEHPPLYTAGTGAKNSDLLNPCFPVYKTGRGGQYTYHGPGQRVAYVMLDLKKRGADIRRYVCNLEEWIIRALADFGVNGERRKGRVGIWVKTLSLPPLRSGLPLPEGRGIKGEGDFKTESKIAAVGVRVRKWVTMHGVSINVNPDLSHYDGIIPCGIDQYGITSLYALGVQAGMADLDAALQRHAPGIFSNAV